MSLSADCSQRLTLNKYEIFNVERYLRVAERDVFVYVVAALFHEVRVRTLAGLTVNVLH